MPFVPCTCAQVAKIVTRQMQLELQASKKAKPADAADEEDCVPKPRKPKAKAKAKAKAKISSGAGKKASNSKGGKKWTAEPLESDEPEVPEEPEEPSNMAEDYDEEWHAPVTKKACKLRRVSKKRKLCKRGIKHSPKEEVATHPEKKTKKMPKVEKEQDESKADRDGVKKSPKKANAGESSSDVATFARRYLPSRPYYQKKWYAIRDAYNARVKPFVLMHSKTEDCWLVGCMGFLM